VLAEQNDEWAESRRYTRTEILTACRKAAQPQMGKEEANDARLSIEVILARWFLIRHPG
jgi:hypothetical protein